MNVLGLVFSLKIQNVTVNILFPFRNVGETPEDSQNIYGEFIIYLLIELHFVSHGFFLN
jgi:hypothetical protein